MKSQIFDAGRFNIGFRKMIMENGKRLMLYGLIVVAVPVLFSILMPYYSDYYLYSDYMTSNDSTGAEDPMWPIMIGFYFFSMVVFASISGSLMFSSMASKEGRTSMLTSPNSVFEKFLMQFIIYFVIFFIVYFCAMIIGDWLRVFSCKLMAENPSMVKPMGLKYMLSLGWSDSLDEEAASIIPTMSYWGCALSIAIFSLGSAVWPKNSFVKTFAFLIAMQMVMGLVAVTSFSVFIHSSFKPRFDLEVNEIMMLINVISAILFTGFYLLAYRRFTESEIINRW